MNIPSALASSGLTDSTRWRCRQFFCTALVAGTLFGCSSDMPPTESNGTQFASITIDSASPVLELGTRTTMTATIRDRAGDKITAPVVWTSSKPQIASFELGGVLVARDTGALTIVAASAGVQSAAVPVRVVWVGPAKIARGSWTPPGALNPGATLRDSLRVVVTNIAGTAVAKASVAFTVTAGGGSVSSHIATTDAAGVASTQWTIGAGLGRNSVTAAVVRADGSPDTLVAQNAVTFSVSSYQALAVQAGAGQTQQILSAVAVAPSVRLVDSLGAPRRGIPVLFTAFGGGHVAVPLVSSGADGVASPGPWTLGDVPGDQMLTATVEDASVTFHATATGTPIHYHPASVVAGAFGTCALDAGGAVSCWGQSPQNGSGDTTGIATPTRVKNSLTAASIAGGSSHFCALTADGAAWCWGASALLDTAGHPTSPDVPTLMSSNNAWSRITTGGQHTCALATDHTAWCWGMNSNGQLGVRDTTRRIDPAAVAGAFTFAQITAGVAHTCALTGDGSAFCWGANQSGQLGDGTGLSRSTPTAVSGGLTFQSIGAGDSFTCGLATTGTVYCWGALAGTTQLVPTAYSYAKPFVALSVGGQHACALTADGSARCWGDNSSGQLGDSTLTARTTPTPVAGGFQFSEISAGHLHTCARTLAGDVVCWGFNGSGELGDRNASLRSVPRYIVLGVTP